MILFSHNFSIKIYTLLATLKNINFYNLSSVSGIRFSFNFVWDFLVYEKTQRKQMYIIIIFSSAYFYENLILARLSKEISFISNQEDQGKFLKMVGFCEGWHLMRCKTNFLWIYLLTVSFFFINHNEIIFNFTFRLVKNNSFWLKCFFMFLIFFQFVFQISFKISLEDFKLLWNRFFLSKLNIKSKIVHYLLKKNFLE